MWSIVALAGLLPQGYFLSSGKRLTPLPATDPQPSPDYTLCWGTCQVIQGTAHPDSLRTVWTPQRGPENCPSVRPGAAVNAKQ